MACVPCRVPGQPEHPPSPTPPSALAHAADGPLYQGGIPAGAKRSEYRHRGRPCGHCASTRPSTGRHRHKVAAPCTRQKTAPVACGAGRMPPPAACGQPGSPRISPCTC
jgi:hypothetical protein